MSEGLEALNYLASGIYGQKQSKEYKFIEKELKALEIIKNKPFNNTWFVFYKDYDEYCLECEYADESKRLTQEEWDSLKEVLK